MQAVVFHGVGDIRLQEVKEPELTRPTDAIVRITASAICGTDLHVVRGTMPGMRPGTILGHEGVGVVEAVGADVRNLREGDRVVVPSTIGCGFCAYCREGYHAQCDNANPQGPRAGTAFFGGPESSGPFNGLQAEKACVPYANVGLVKLPDAVTDDQAILLSDIFPTGYFGAELAQIEPGDAVAVFGCGPVGLFALLSARLLGAGRVLAVDTVPSRLDAARGLGAEVIDFNAEDPVETIRRLTGSIGVDRAIDAVGVDATAPRSGPAAARSAPSPPATEGRPDAAPWHPGDAPAQALFWAVDALCKAGTLAVIGVYPETARSFPIGAAMNRNLTIQTGNCNHRRYIPRLLELVAGGVVDPAKVLSHEAPLRRAVEAYQAFDARQPGWIKVKLEPARLAA